jgi:mannose-6-phosphate isomerase-like protein (cupin superfamily)
MTGYVGNIEKHTLKNNYFRQVLFTGKKPQLVVMCLQRGEEIGNEVHRKVDQFFRIEQGKAKFIRLWPPRGRRIEPGPKAGRASG